MQLYHKNCLICCHDCAWLDDFCWTCALHGHISRVHGKSPPCLHIPASQFWLWLTLIAGVSDQMERQLRSCHELRGHDVVETESQATSHPTGTSLSSPTPKYITSLILKHFGICKGSAGDSGFRPSSLVVAGKKGNVGIGGTCRQPL